MEDRVATGGRSGGPAREPLGGGLGASAGAALGGTPGTETVATCAVGSGTTITGAAIGGSSGGASQLPAVAVTRVGGAILGIGGARRARITRREIPAARFDGISRAT
ncbi:MAG TPA: hypothetical protein PLV92_22400, partial [Pirellulaceae bacterium]|nr:hypothetical protein [Pirellulaceae bacterium]